MTLSHLLQTPAGKQWEKISPKQHHGINLPLFSLHSQKSCGIGEYSDLLPIIEWCCEVGMDVIQLLPLNDGGDDPSPYNALSAFALNPIYLALADLPNSKNDQSLREKIEKLQALNSLERVDYKKVIPLKREFLKEYCQKEASAIKGNKEFYAFMENSYWVKGYALFLALKEKFNGSSWEEWPQEFQQLSKERRELLQEEEREAIERHAYIQYLCAQQLEGVKRKAAKEGLLIKGDIPILISRDSADVWQYQHLFNLEYQAGAPPDIYAEEGQAWGFPTYNWKAIEKEGYRWWKERLKEAEKFYDIYRIDHIVGFFRIWAIPLGKAGHEGKFDPSDEREWIDHGKKIITMMLESSTMLPIGEDLGVVPTVVRTTLREMGICGTKVMRWERWWHGDQSYIPKEEYIEESLTSVSTHDSESLAGWWEDYPEEAKLYATTKGWEYHPSLTKEQKVEILKESHQTKSLFHINLLQEYLSLIPSYSKEAEAERVNLPGSVSDKNWSFRCKASVEEIFEKNQLKRIINTIIK